MCRIAPNHAMLDAYKLERVQDGERLTGAEAYKTALGVCRRMVGGLSYNTTKLLIGPQKMAL